jgi:hypothetical protein
VSSLVNDFLQTTLLSRLLKNANGLRIAVLVNDLAEVSLLIISCVCILFFSSGPCSGDMCRTG